MAGRYLVAPIGIPMEAEAGIVPADGFTLQERDVVEIEISGIGLLRNTVVPV